MLQAHAAYTLNVPGEQMTRARMTRALLVVAMSTIVAAGTLAFGPAEAATNAQVLDGQVTRLYRAYFLRNPEAEGRDYWVGRRSAGMPLRDISEYFAGSPEFKTRYGALDNAAFVDLVYKNVLDRTPDASGRAYWISSLDSGRAKRGAVMIGFSESPEFVAKTGTTPPNPPTTSTTTTTTTKPQPGCSTAGIYAAANGTCVANYRDGSGDVDCGQLPAATKPITVLNPGNDPDRLDSDGDGQGCETT